MQREILFSCAIPVTTASLKEQVQVDNKEQSKLNDAGQRACSGKISRKDFLRSAGVLGLSLSLGEFLAGCKPSVPSTPTPDQRFQALIPQTDNIIPTPFGGETVSNEPAAGVERSPMSAPALTPAPNISWMCATCGQRFQSVDMYINHASREHTWRLPEITKVDKPTYSEFVVGKVTRFDERNTVFSRTLWDEKYQALLASITPKILTDEAQDLEGQAQTAGAIYVDDTAGSFHPNYYGYMGRVKGVGGLYSWDDPVNSVQFPVPSAGWMTERIKEVARFYGADLVGVCKLDQRWIYSHTFERSTGKHERNTVPYRYAIVMGIEMDWERINASPGRESSAATALIYSRMAELAGSLAKYIRVLGYAAAPSGNDSGQNIPLAIDAGLGELGRNGLLITPEYGPRVRICKVFTDLPLEPDQPVDFGMRSFCETCHSCALSCPAKAIRNEERTTEITSISNRKGLLRWPVDVAKCYLFWRENRSDCSNCIAVCPWALHSQRDWLELQGS